MIFSKSVSDFLLAAEKEGSLRKAVLFPLDLLSFFYGAAVRLRVLLYRRGLYSMAARQWAEACVHFDGAAMTGAPEAPIHSWYAAALHASGDRDEACALFDEFWPQLSPRERAAFHRTLARMLPGNKAYRDEIRDITRPLEWMPSAPASASRRAS